MDPDFKRLLALSEENNRMLHKLVNDLRMRRIWGFIRWTVIIGAALGLYWWFQPYLETLMTTYQTAVEQFNALRNGFGR